MLLPEQLSADVGAVHVTTAPQTPLSLLTEILLGRATMVGFWLSATITVNDPEVVFDEASVAV